MALVLVTYNTI